MKQTPKEKSSRVRKGKERKEKERKGGEMEWRGTEKERKGKNWV